MDKVKIHALVESLIRLIRQANGDLLVLFPIQRYISMLDSQNLHGHYGNIPASASSYSKQIDKLPGNGLMEMYHKLVLVTLIGDFDARLSKRKLPNSVIELFHNEFSRIADDISRQEDSYYVTSNDLYLKDLAICRLKLYPCGPELVDELSGISRKIIISGNIGQFRRATRFFLLRGHKFRPYYELHMHAPLREHFHPDGWIACYRRIAELLELNQELEGVICSSWWYDPQLETVSPRLNYLRRFLVENGAELFYVKSDINAAGGAIEKSATRRRLLESGEYVPHIYTAIWPRFELIRWANTFGKKENE